MNPQPALTGNAILDQLPSATRARLLKLLEPVHFELGVILYEARSVIEFAYFPITCALSALVVMRNGSMIEVGTVGREGMVGLPDGVTIIHSPNRVLVQISGAAYRITIAALRKEAAGDDAIKDLFSRYNAAFQFQVSQSVACNGLHTLQQRCCRWLLMTHDAIDGDLVELTHEFLAAMVGVRRAGVTELLQLLKQKGIVDYGRQKIQIINREGLEKLACECYQDVREEYTRLLG